MLRIPVMAHYKLLAVRDVVTDPASAYVHLTSPRCGPASRSDDTLTGNPCWERRRRDDSRRRRCRPRGGRDGPRRDQDHSVSRASKACGTSGAGSMTLGHTDCTWCPPDPCTAATHPNLADISSTVAVCGCDADEGDPKLPVRKRKQDITVTVSICLGRQGIMLMRW